MPKATRETASAGTPGKSLLARLGWKPDMTAVAIAPPENYADLVDAAPIATTDAAPEAGTYGFIHLFVRETAELNTILPALGSRLLEGGMIWVSWPMPTSPRFKDVTEDSVRSVALPLGLVDVKTCPIDGDWAGLKLVQRKVG